jgi:hypothetical protein
VIGTCKNRSQAAGSSSRSLRIVASNGLGIDEYLSYQSQSAVWSIGDGDSTHYKPR